MTCIDCDKKVGNLQSKVIDHEAEVKFIREHMRYLIKEIENDTRIEYRENPISWIKEHLEKTLDSAKLGRL